MSTSESQKECLGTSEGDNEEDNVRETIETENEQTSQIDKQLVLAEPIVSRELESTKYSDIVYEGMVFESEEEAYEKYNELARRVGFSVRKSKTYRRADGSVRCRMFVCFRQGFRTRDSRYPYVKKERKGIRTGCMARMMIKNEKVNEWIVSELVFEHNHPLENPEKIFTLRSHRKVEDSQATKSEKLDIVGIQPPEGFDYKTQQPQEHENNGDENVDCESFLQKKRNEELGPEGACVMLNYFARKQSENPTFFYATMVDDENQMTNFFWADAMSIIDYNHFGDVVVLDTTYRTSKYSRPFALFAGVNHHKQTVIFGSALLIDESNESFVWLFKTWMKVMSGKKPKTILTDQCEEIAKALSIVLPETRHRLCLWHIFQNGAKHLPHLYRNPNFQHVFKKCLYHYETEEEFIRGWEKMLQDYKVVRNRWLLDIFKVRQEWALVYGRDMFCADMTTSHRGKSISRFLKNFVRRRYSLAEFLTCYERALASKRHKELEEECESIRTLPNLIVPTPMLKQAADKYTHAMFEVFENEFKEHLMCKIEDRGVNGMICKFEVTQEGHARAFVTIDPSSHQVVCSCKKYEFVGILCHHIIKVLYHKNIHDIPPRYILKRWTKDAKIGVAREQDRNLIQADGNSAMFFRYNGLLRKAVSIAIKGAINEEVHEVAKRVLDNGFKEIVAAAKATQGGFVNSSHNTPGVEEMLAAAEGSERGQPCEARLTSGLEEQRKKKAWTKFVESTDAVKATQEAFVNSSHKTPGVEEIFTAAEGTERDQPSEARVMRGLEEQRKKKTWTKLVESTDNMDHPQNKKVKKGQNNKVLTQVESNGPSIDPSCPQWAASPASTFGISGYDSYPVVHPSMPYISSQYTQGSSVPGFQASSFTNTITSSASHNQLLSQVSFISREPQLLANLFPQPHSTSTVTTSRQPSRQTNLQPELVTLASKSSMELSQLREPQLSPDRLNINHDNETS